MSHQPTEIKVRGYHLDMFGHVNNARYLEFLEEARWARYEAFIGHPDFKARGWAFLVANINISYRAPAGFGQVLQISTELEKVGKTSATLRQRVVEQGTEKEIADALVTFVVLDTGTSRPVPMAGELLEMLEQS